MAVRRIIFIVALAVVAVLFSLVMLGVHIRSGEMGLESTVQEIKRCTSQRDAIGCARPAIRRTVASASASVLMDALATELPALHCHYMGHVLGQELYQAHGGIERAIGECSRSCQDACVHGVLGSAFTDAMEGAGSVDTEHISLEEIRQKGKEFCVSGNACHGVGHALFQLLQDFDTALPVCADIASAEIKVYCYRGVFMEYADASAARSVLSYEPPAQFSIKELESLCMRESFEASRACFMYLPKMIEVALQEAGEKSEAVAYVRKNVCATLSGEDHLACVGGLGGYRSFYMFTEPAAVRSMCQSFANVEERSACAAGVAFTAAEHEDKQEKTFAFCASFAEERVAAACYRAIFDTYTTLNETADPQQVCKNDARCLRASTRDPE